MIETIWTYRVKPERRADFERTYAADGDWARLFAKGDGYRGTTLMRDTGDAGRYATVDRWDDEASFQGFKHNFEREYQELDRTCENLTVGEEHVGVFEILKM